MSKQFEKGDDNTVTEKGEITTRHDPILGDTKLQQFDQHQLKGESALTGPSKDGLIITHFINQEYFDKNSTNDAPFGEDGNKIENPIWLVIYHELGGHGYLNYEIHDKQQSGKTVDYENIIRNLTNLPKRAYDDVHKNPNSNQ